MIFHDQSIVHTESTNGNCWVTSLACILNLPEVPEFDIMSGVWWENSEEIANAVGCTLLEVEFDKVARWPAHGAPCIASGLSPRSPVKEGDGMLLHSVIGQVINEGRRGFGVDYMHDPHPSRDNLADVRFLTFILPMSQPNNVIL